MKFAPKSEEQIAKENLLEAGIYDFEIMGAEDKKSKNGNDMIELSIKVFRPDGGFVYVRDWLLEAMAFKLIHFCRATGLSAKYDAGTLTAQDCHGATGKLRLEIKVQDGFPPKNSVKDYGEPKKPAGMGDLAPGTVRQTTMHRSAPQPAATPAGGDDSEPPF